MKKRQTQPAFFAKRERDHPYPLPASNVTIVPAVLSFVPGLCGPPIKMQGFFDAATFPWLCIRARFAAANRAENGAKTDGIQPLRVAVRTASIRRIVQ